MPIYDVLPVPPNPPVGGTLRYCVDLPADLAYLSVILGCMSFGADEESYNNPNTPPPDSSLIQAAFATALATIEECENTLIGTIQAASYKDGVSPPDGWLLCDGSSYPVDDYPLLVEQSRMVLVSGSNFLVPDLRERKLRGGTVPSNARGIGGSDTKTLNLSNVPSHSHQVNGIAQSIVTVGTGAPVSVLISASPGFPFPTGNTGSGSPFGIVNRFMYTDFYIVGR